MTKARTAPSSSRTLSAAKARKRLGSARDQFEFVPEELVAECLHLIQRYHAGKPFGSVADVIWRSDAHRLVKDHPALRILFEYACSTRGAKLARQRQEDIAALILAAEILVREFGGWSAQFPQAKQQADRLFTKLSIDRGWLIGIYGYPTLDFPDGIISQERLRS
ncbi:MAG TPA: hypothetical protein VME45_19925 [Stellaceae bacterium]|nr:hypothetical protein [Stellaceae bacterium]